MPIYEYRCASCGAELEKLRKISDPPLVECPECGKDTLVKLVSASSFRLKGSGWYETDFKTGKKKNGLAEESNTSSDAAGTSAAGNSSAGGSAAAPGAPESAKAATDAGSKTTDGGSEKKAATKEATKSTDSAGAKNTTPKA
jgi:putative FmdB family regulatory protein